MAGIDIRALRAAVGRGSILWRQHALERMVSRGIGRDAVKVVLLEGELIEDYPDGWPFPSGLFGGYWDDRPLHVVAAYDATQDQAFVITTYEPDDEHFEGDRRTRRE